ncbi:ATP-binding cassette domain-containing protein [Lusitaniella coriacea LEGE 07157]|uniref:ATP-binding cassette domain-containing protein n=1 Tax=Lusitaniella coriacea LEGE 07157 TaxID=945747 RepID=A0A8J7B6G6_9CYAN|nr:ATP-binding cassette domain-containing protein [Lusitaniella coriacea]MBE9114286.1 ATP-binding cassette domain-containing protein [Lusitaniella coriacea LEGE 07157]
MKSIVTIQNLNHYYQEGKERKQVLFDVNLKIEAGETFFLTGESGSGKTTLISLIGCLRSVQEGSLTILDRELRGANENQLMNLRRNLGYVFQHFNLLDFMTIRQNVQISLELQENFNPDRARSQSEAILKEVGLGHRTNAYPRELSGGQKQRVSLARALVHRPKLILADEPTASLDSKTGREVVELIQRLAKQQGSAVLIVTHNTRMFDLADRIVRIEDGKLGVGYGEQISLILPTLTDTQLNEISSNLELRTYEPHATIIRQGDRADEFYILIEGRVDAIKEDENSQEVLLRQLKQGDYFGEIGLLKRRKRTATVRVVADAEAKVLVMNREAFLQMISESNLTNAVISHQSFQRLLSERLVKKSAG